MAASKKPATKKPLRTQPKTSTKPPKATAQTAAADKSKAAAKAAKPRPSAAPPGARQRETSAKAAAGARQDAAPDKSKPGKGPRGEAKGDVYVALMRGINVGGNNMIPMKELTALFIEAGCGDVRTYIQSGNVVFRAGAAVVKGLHAAIERALIARFGSAVPLVLRSWAELADCERSNPYFTKEADPARLVVMFLDQEPTAAAVATLDPARSPPDEFVVRGRDIYIHCPNGLGRSKLTNAYFDGKLHAVSTGRNWNTVVKLLAMCAE